MPGSWNLKVKIAKGAKAHNSSKTEMDGAIR